MKKILLTSAVVAMLSSASVLAHDNENNYNSSYSSEGKFYVQGHAGWNKLRKYGSVKSEDGVFFSGEVGYNMMDNFRGGVSFVHFLHPTYTTNVNKFDEKVKIKGEANAVLANVYYDLFDAGFVKMVVGAGVGVSQVKASGIYTKNTTGEVRKATMGQKNNVALAGYLGGAYPVKDGITVELMYSYKDFGKTKSHPWAKNVHFGAHNLGAGLRVDF